MGNKRLTPNDSELFLMIESLTGNAPQITIGAEKSYRMVVRVEGLGIDIQKAVADAIDGRIGKRLLSVD